MEVLENLRFKSIPRFQRKDYEVGTKRIIKNRLHAGYMFVVKGELIYTYNHKKYICDQNHCILFSKGIDYSFVVTKKAVCRLIDFEEFKESFHGIYYLQIGEVESFYNSFLRMEKRYNEASESFELIGLSMLYDITARINGYGHKETKYLIIEKSEKYLENNIFDNELSIKRLAEESNVSEVYFRKLFKEKYNVSPIKYINEARIDKAKQLLIDEDNNVSEIATMCGYSDVYSFSRAFKKIIGVSPKKFKTKHLSMKK